MLGAVDWTDKLRMRGLHLARVQRLQVSPARMEESALWPKHYLNEGLVPKSRRRQMLRTTRASQRLLPEIVLARGFYFNTPFDGGGASTKTLEARIDEAMTLPARARLRDSNATTSLQARQLHNRHNR